MGWLEISQLVIIATKFAVEGMTRARFSELPAGPTAASFNLGIKVNDRMV
jgi:hypothetical protein